VVSTDVLAREPALAVRDSAWRRAGSTSSRFANPRRTTGPDSYRNGSGGPNMWFVRVPEGTTAKNRIHFDLWPTSATRDEQVQRAIDLGAVVLHDRRRADGAGWVVFADLRTTASGTQGTARES
jgi:Glyoxalase-like domain